MDELIDAYLRQLQALLPPGPAWAPDDPALAANLRALAAGMARAHERIDGLLREADPRQALELLPDWEAGLGLPDACTVGAPTLAERRAAVVARLTDPGGARVPRYLKLAADLGYPGATITRFRYHSCELDCEQPVHDLEWRFAWQLNLPAGVRVVDSTAESGVEEALRSWGDTLMECVLRREAPAQSTLLIAYGG